MARGRAAALGLGSLAIALTGCGARAMIPEVAVVAAAPAVVFAPQGPPVPVAVHLGPAPGAGVWAVVIGIDDYPGEVNDLQGGVADAETVLQALDRAGVPVEQRYVLRETEATAPAIADAARWLAANAGPESTAAFAYAGHAVHLGGTSHALVGADGMGLSDIELATALAPLRARATWLLIAACYGGGFNEAVLPGRILTGASGPDDVSYENAGMGGSYLVEYLVRRAWLEGRSGPSVQDAIAWAASALLVEAPDCVPWLIDATTEPLVLGPLGVGAVAQPVPVPAALPSPPPAVAAPGRSRLPSPAGSSSRPPEECRRLGILVACP